MTKNALIYLLPKNVMQSGLCKSGVWVLELDDMVKMEFPNLDSAVRYAVKHKIKYQILPHYSNVQEPKSYMKNFKN